MSMLRIVAALVSLVCGTWLLEGCGGNAEPVRVPDAYAHPPDPVPCPREERFNEPESARPRAAPGSFDARSLIGMTEGNAEERAREYGCTIRVAIRDGEGQVLSGDDLLDRVDVYIENRRVMGIRPG